jgi:repressor LexA
MMARRPSKTLSERHKKILEVLETFQIDFGYPPSIREICEKASISSTSVVNYYLDQLKKLGYIERDEQVARGIRLVKQASGASFSLQQATSAAGARPTGSLRPPQPALRPPEGLLQIPVVGRIFASIPVPVPASDFSYYDAESMVEVASSLLPGGERSGGNLFALEVKGDSMIDAMINEGDLVIMKPAVEARNGEMVAVWLNDRDETTLKYFFKEKDRIRLQPANPTMGPIYVDDPASIEIKGKVIMVIRKVSGPVL